MVLASLITFDDGFIKALRAVRLAREHGNLNIQSACCANVLCKNVFFIDLGSILIQIWGLWHPLGFTFAPLKPCWEHFGRTFCVKKRTGPPKVPQERPKAPTPQNKVTHLGTFLELMGVTC